MTPLIKHVLATTAVLAVVSATAFGIFVQSGAYNFAADVPHTKLVFTLLDRMRERSVESRSNDLRVPDLSGQQRIVQGAGNYNAMCVQCHRSPGMGETELSKGLYPSPPNLATESVEATHAFWVIKHGIKASGMPAWGKSMNDDYVWNMVAFLQALPKLDDRGYRSMVAQSGGHSHGGGETHGAGEPDDHGEEQGEHHHDHAETPVSKTHAPIGLAGNGTVHTHANGKQHIHSPTGGNK
jgi:mono/diheme cytochrome c family protein